MVETKPVTTNFDDKSVICKTKNFYILLSLFILIDIKNRTCYYFDDIMRVGDINFSDILLEEK